MDLRAPVPPRHRPGSPSTPTDDARSPGFLAAVLVTGAAIFVFGVDAGLLSVALPDIEAAFPEASRATISWASTGYTVAGVSLLLIAGRLGDRIGRRRVFQVGMAAFGIGAVITAVAPTVGWLLAGRVLSGAGSALFTATGLAILLREVPLERKALAVGAWGFMGSVGFVVGPTGGGIVADVAGWRLAFFLLAPITLIAAVAAARVLREYANPHAAGPTSATEIVIASAGVAAITVSLSQSGRWGWSDGRVAVLLATGITAAVVLVVRSGRDGALLDRRLWRHRPFVLATAGAGVQQAGFLPWFVTLGFVLRRVWEWSAFETGCALSLGMLVSAVVNIAGGRLADRAGYVGVVCAGAAVAALGPLYWVVTMETEPDFWGVYVPGLVVFMIGAGVAGILPTGAALGTIPEPLLGVANATHSTARRLCASIGLAVMAALLGEGSGAALLDGAKAVFVMVAVAHLALVPFMVAYGRAARNA